MGLFVCMLAIGEVKSYDNYEQESRQIQKDKKEVGRYRDTETVYLCALLGSHVILGSG